MTCPNRVSRISCSLIFLALISLIAINGCGGDQADVIELPELAVPDQNVMNQVGTKLRLAYQTAGTMPEQAMVYFSEIVHLAPESPMPYYHYAFGLALQGKTESAIDTLRIAVEKGLCDPAIIERASQFAEVIKHEDWSAMRDEMLVEQKQYYRPGMASYRELDEAPSEEFASLEEVRAHYATKIKEASALVMLNSESKVRLHLWHILNQKLASLEKLKKTDLADDQMLLVDREICMVTCSFEESNRTPWLASTVSAIEEKTEAFVAKYQDKAAECSEASYMQARAKWYRTQPADPSELTTDDLSRAVEIFTAVDRQYPGQTGSFLGLMDVLNIVADREGYDSTLLPGLVDKIDGGYNSMFAQRQFQQLRYSYVPIRLAVRGMPEFTVTDLDGKEWVSTQLSDKLTLVDFWATWCSPCIRELPGLVELYKTYHDRGFEILGLSLDEANKLTTEELISFMKDKGMTWPMVYDGKGWGTPPVANCGVGSIPFPILIDANGKILAAGGAATGANLHAMVAEFFGE